MAGEFADLPDHKTASVAAGSVFSMGSDQFTPRNFATLAELIHRYSGIKMPAGKQTMLEGRLRRRAASLGLGTLNDYCDYLFQDEGSGDELIHLIDAVTTNKTEFFREPIHFDFLRDTALPEFAAAGRRHVKLWSAAASIGAEAYTIAMVLEDYRRSTNAFHYSILATDICTEVLAVALAGRFPRAMMEPIPPELRRQHVWSPRDETSNEMRMAPHLRAKLSIARLNLMDESYPVEQDMDVIFCRNILIYFDRRTQEQVLARLCRHLRSDGYLILGHSEAAVDKALPLDHVVNTIFRRC